MVNLSGTAGQSFGTFLSAGVTLNLTGEEMIIGERSFRW